VLFRGSSDRLDDEEECGHHAAAKVAVGPDACANELEVTGPMRLVKRFAEKAAWALRVAEDAFLGASVITIVVAIFADVIKRAVTHTSLFGTDELSRYLLVAMVFIGAGTTTRLGNHLKIDFLRWFVRGRKLDVVNIAADLLSLVVACFLLYWVSGYTLDSFRLHETSSLLRAPMYLVKGTMVIGTLLMVLYFIVRIIRGVLALKTNL